MPTRLTLFLGGARSGKSRAAERLATQAGESVLYVATAQAHDEEMVARIADHRRDRAASWRTLEAPLHVASAINDEMERFRADAVLLDCVTLLVSNAILAGAGQDADQDHLDEKAANARVSEEIGDLLEACRLSSIPWIVVSNEVGMGLVPPYPMGRIYRDALGRANQQLAAEASQVYLMIAGLAVDLRRLSDAIS